MSTIGGEKSLNPMPEIKERTGARYGCHGQITILDASIAGSKVGRMRMNQYSLSRILQQVSAHRSVEESLRARRCVPPLHACGLTCGVDVERWTREN